MSYKGIKANVYYLSTPELIKGSDLVIKTQMIHKGSGDPYLIKDFAGATAYFENDDDTALEIVGELLSSTQGVCSFEIPASASEGLKASEEGSFEVHLEDTRGLTIMQITEALVIKDRLF